MLGRRRHSTVSYTADEAGVTRLDGGEPVDRVEYAGLDAVLVMTTADGPFAEDVFFVLRPREGPAMVVPQGAMPATVVASLQQLDGFDNEALIEAMMSTADAEFVLWRADIP